MREKQGNDLEKDKGHGTLVNGVYIQADGSGQDAESAVETWDRALGFLSSFHISFTTVMMLLFITKTKMV